MIGVSLTAHAAAFPAGPLISQFSDQRAETFTASNFLSETSGNGPQMGNSRTFVMLVDGVTSAGGFFWGHTNSGATRGWVLGCLGGGQPVLIVRGSVNLSSAYTLTGLLCFAVTITSGGQVRMSVNGRAVEAKGAYTYTPAVAGDTHAIGTQAGLTGFPHPGGVFELVHLTRAASDAELVEWSRTAHADNRMELPSTLTGDASCSFWWKAGVHWSSAGATSVSGGSAPVTFSKSGSPTLAAAVERRIVPSYSYFDDNLTAAPMGSGSDAFVRHNQHARLRLVTSATKIGVDIVATNGSYPKVAVYSDGVYQSAPAAIAGDGKRNVVEVTLPAGAGKVVEILEGTVNDNPGSVGATLTLTALQAVREIGASNTITLSQPTLPASRMVVYGDSITAYSSTLPQKDAWPSLVRADYPGAVTVEAWGGRSLHLDGVDATSRATLAARLVEMCQRTSGTKRLWLAIGTNDYGLNKWSAANFGTAYADLLDKIHALDSSIAIWAQSPITRTTETANSFGNTLGDYRTQISDAASARSGWCTYVNGAAWSITLADGLHPNDAGHSTYKTNVKAAIGY